MKWKSIAGILFLCTLAVTVPAAPVGYAAYPSYTGVTQAVQAYVQKDAAARNFNLLSVQISTPQVQQTGTTVTLNYVATTTHTLNFASAGDSPVVRGISAYLANNPGLSVTARTQIQSLLDSWKTRIQGYIDNPFTSSEAIEATASVDSAGNVIPGTVKLFVGYADGSVLTGNQALAEIPSNGTVLSLFEANPTGIANPSFASPNVSNPYNVYNATNAISYAETYVDSNCNWTNNGGNDNTCQNNTAQGFDCVEYPAYYNKSYWYSGMSNPADGCDDCANFVSQTMAAGGIPTVSGVWYEDSSGDGVPGTYDWVNAGGLEQFMTTHSGSAGVPYWQVLASKDYVAQGDTVVFGDGKHTMIAVYGDGTSALFAGHTNDDYDSQVSQSGTTFYGVSDWITTN